MLRCRLSSSPLAVQTTWQERSFRSSGHRMASHIHFFFVFCFFDSHGVTALRWRRCGAFLSVFRSGRAIGFPQLHNRRLIEAILARATFSAPFGARGPRLFEYEPSLPSRRRADGRRHQTDVPSSAASSRRGRRVHLRKRLAAHADWEPVRVLRGLRSRFAFLRALCSGGQGCTNLCCSPDLLEIPTDLQGRTAYQDTLGDLSALL